MTARLLVTGFGPFPRVPRNPSGRAALAVAASPRWRLAGVAARGLVLTTAYAALAAELDPALATGADAVLLIGVAGRSRAIRVEWRATSRRSSLFADAAGRLGPGANEVGSAVRRTRLPPVKPLRALRRQALPSRISRDAGRYLCNAAYFRALAEDRPVLFIHVPMPPASSARRTASRRHRLGYDDRLSAALVEIGRSLLIQARSEVTR